MDTQIVVLCIGTAGTFAATLATLVFSLIGKRNDNNTQLLRAREEREADMKLWQAQRAEDREERLELARAAERDRIQRAELILESSTRHQEELKARIAVTDARVTQVDAKVEDNTAKTIELGQKAIAGAEAAYEAGNNNQAKFIILADGAAINAPEIQQLAHSAITTAGQADRMEATVNDTNDRVRALETPISEMLPALVPVLKDQIIPAVTETNELVRELVPEPVKNRRSPDGHHS